jgi:hypothetical protein
METRWDDCELCELMETEECPRYNDSEAHEMSGISKETFMDMSTDSKLGVLFDYMVAVQQAQPKRVHDRDLKCAKKASECNRRFVKIERRLGKYKVLNTVAAFLGGFVGGWSAIWASFKLSIFK